LSLREGFRPLKTPAFLSLLAALVLLHCATGGTTLAYALPILALLGGAALLGGRGPAPGTATVSGPCLAATGGLFAYLLLRAVFSPVAYLARADVFLMLACLTVYLLTALYLVTARQRLAVLGAILALGLLHTGVGIAQAAWGEDFMLFGFMRPTSGTRASGLYISPNHYAGFLEMVLVLGLSVVWWSNRAPTARIFAGWAALCAGAGLLLSQSRGGVLCAGVALAAWAGVSLWTHSLKRPQGLGIAFFAIIAAVALFAGVGAWVASQHFDLQQRLATTFERDIRLANWAAATDQFHSAPVFGTGAGTHLYLGRLYRRPELQSDPIHAHNDYLELLAEYGLVGGAGMLVLLALHARHGGRAIGRCARLLRARGDGSRDELALLIGALAAGAGMAAHSFIDFNLHIPGNAVVMAFLFGLLANPEVPDEKPAPLAAPSGAVSAARRVLPWLGGALLGLALVAWPGEFFNEKARIHLRNGEYPVAIASGARARQLDPWNPFSAFYLGEACRLAVAEEPDYAARQALRNRAERAFADGLRLFPQDENLLVRRAQVLGELKRLDEAEASFQAALAADPQLEVLRQLYEEYRERYDEPPGAL
jgi:O-antigen ligase